MNLLQTIRTIEEVAKGIPNVHTVVSAFEDLNREDTVYSAVIIQQQSHTHNDDWMQYNFYIGYADRLVEDGSNEISVQSTAMNTIHSIVRALRNILPSAEISYSNTNAFTQRFTALCAGAYETVSIILPISECDDSNEGIPGLDTLSTTITKNGDYNFIPDGLGFDSVHVVVDLQPEVSLEERSVSINENGQVIVTTTPGFTGMSRVNINVAVPQEGGYKEGYDEGYSKGHQEGVTEGYADGVATQKSKLQDITITNNGTYDREDGYKHIVVDVPASAAAEGYTININENGTFTYTPQEGVVWNSITVIANVPTEGGYQEGYEAGYAAGREAGYTEGYAAGREAGKAEGIAEQKAKLGSIEITENGTYEKEDGYNRVVVNVESHEVNLQEKTTNPATTAVEVTPDLGFDGLSKVTVNPVDSNIDPNIVPENIKTGVTVLGVEGTFKGEKPEERFNIQPTTSDQTITPTEGKVFSGGTVKAVTSSIDSNIQPENIKNGVTILGVGGTLKEEKPEETFNVQPTTTDQIIAPREGYAFSGGTVKAVTSEIDANIASNNIKEGVTILGVEGTLKEGKPEESFNIQPTTAEQTIAPREGYTFSGGTVKAVTSTIDSNIQPENIKEGVSILGVVGTLSEGGGSDVFVVPDGTKFSRSTFTKVPSNWDFSNVTDMTSMFYGCKNLTTIPLLDTSKITDMNNMLSNCSNLTTIPQLDTSKVTDMSSMLYQCTNLTTIPQLDTQNVTDMSSMLAWCTNLTTIPQLNTSNVTNMVGMFSMCSNLTTIPQLNTSKVTNMDSMLGYCNSLTTVEGIDFSGLTKNLNYLFGSGASSMPNLTRFIVNGKINVSISDNKSIKALTAIDYDSVKSILAAANRTDNTDAKELAFNRTMTDQNGELAALVASCSTKGWTITGLTLQ